MKSAQRKKILNRAKKAVAKAFDTFIELPTAHRLEIVTELERTLPAGSDEALGRLWGRYVGLLRGLYEAEVSQWGIRHKSAIFYSSVFNAIGNFGIWAYLFYFQRVACI